MGIGETVYVLMLIGIVVFLAVMGGIIDMAVDYADSSKATICQCEPNIQ